MALVPWIGFGPVGAGHDRQLQGRKILLVVKAELPPTPRKRRNCSLESSKSSGIEAGREDAGALLWFERCFPFGDPLDAMHPFPLDHSAA